MSQGCTFTHSLNLIHGFTPKRELLSAWTTPLHQTPLLPPKASLNSNPGSYQSDEQGSQVGSQALPGSFV
jgi:hypothetical protein